MNGARPTLLAVLVVALAPGAAAQPTQPPAPPAPAASPAASPAAQPEPHAHHADSSADAHAGHAVADTPPPRAPRIRPAAPRAAMPLVPDTARTVTRRHDRGDVAAVVSLVPLVEGMPDARGGAAPAASARVDTVARRGLLEREEFSLRLELRDRRTGAPVASRFPLIWVDPRGTAEPTSDSACMARVGRHTASKVYSEAGLKTRAVADLNSYFVVTLNRSATLAVLDPVMGFGRTRLYTTVPLRSTGADWALDAERGRLYVSMPAVGKIAVVETATWKVQSEFEAGPAPTQLALAGDGRTLWVTNAPATGRSGGVSAVDAESLALLGTVRTGAGPHALTLAGPRAFVADAGAGTVTVVDAARPRAPQVIRTGGRPSAVTYAAAANAVLVADSAAGTLAFLDAASGAPGGRVRLTPGIGGVFAKAPAPAGGHAGHGGHGGHGGEGTEPGRVAYVTHPAGDRVYVIDAVGRRVVREVAIPGAPDEVAFTSGFAYVRGARSTEVHMLPLDAPLTGGTGKHDRFPVGRAAGGVAPTGSAAAVVSAPDMPDAVYVMNGADRMLYYYHFMEGMPVPSGGLTTYAFEPKAVLTVGRSLRETAPGVYGAAVRLDRPGQYDVTFALDAPRVVHCFAFDVFANPALRRGQVALQVEALDTARTLRVGDNEVRLRLVDAFRNARLTGVRDVTVLVAAPGGAQQRVRARPEPDGVYVVRLRVGAPGVQYLSFEIPSLRVSPEDRRPEIFVARAAAAGAAGAAGAGEVARGRRDGR